jgi:quercetin dioxygenase-like cupin family protein
MDKLSLDAVAREQLEVARRSPSGRAAETVFGGHEKTLRQTVIAMTGGRTLAEHENPGEATLLVLQGSVRLRSDDADQEGRDGDLMVVPPNRHSLEALEDSAVLLTVAKLP